MRLQDLADSCQVGQSDQSGDRAGGQIRLATLVADRRKSRAPVQGVEELPGKSNYWVGLQRCDWRSNVTNVARMEYRAVYPGIDLVWYGNQ